MMDVESAEDLFPFEGLELEEPSARTDAAILGRARRPALAVRPASRRVLAAHAALAATLVVALAILIPASREPSPEAAGPTAIAPPAAPEAARPLTEDVAELRTELDEIREMTELIPGDLIPERETIERRIRVCLGDLENLERKILIRSDRGGLPATEAERKEARI